jgi:serine/threonine protein kinase
MKGFRLSHWRFWKANAEALNQRKKMEIDQVLDLSAQIADALDAVHAKHIIHRDINRYLFITEREQAKVTSICSTPHSMPI